MATKALFIFGILLVLVFIEAAIHKSSFNDAFDSADPNLVQFIKPCPGQTQRLEHIEFKYVIGGSN